MPFTFSIAEYADLVLRTAFTLVMQFMPQQNTSNMPQTVEYQMEEFLLKFTSIARHQYFPIFTLQLREFNQDLDEQSNIVRKVQRSLHTSTNIQRNARHLYVHPYERMENTTRTGHVPIPNAVSATSWTRQL